MPKLTTHEKLRKLKRIKFTKEGFAKLERDLKRLKSDRPAAVKELARARELGDLSENGLYTAAKSRLISIDNNIFRIEMTMKLADVVNPGSSSAIQIGSQVIVEDQGKEIMYKIVGDTEANPKEHKVTQNSPLGISLLGKKSGDQVNISLPAGKKSLIIKKIS